MLCGFEKIARLLIRKGADVANILTSEDLWKKKRTGFSIEPSMVKLVLRHGAKVAGGEVNPLVYAVRRGLDDIAELLMQHGAELVHVVPVRRKHFLPNYAQLFAVLTSRSPHFIAAMPFKV